MDMFWYNEKYVVFKYYRKFDRRNMEEIHLQLAPASLPLNKTIAHGLF